MRTASKVALIPLALLAEAAGGIYWLIYGFWLGHDRQDRARQRYAFGFLAPEMDQHWVRLSAWGGIGKAYEDLKNIVSEWARLDPQRAAKLLLAALLTALAACATAGILAANIG